MVTVLDRASSIGVDARLTPLDPPGDAEGGATEQRILVIAFPESDRRDAPGAGDAYGDVRIVGNLEVGIDGHDRTRPRSGRDSPSHPAPCV
jgi:hypothetical protein